MEDDCISIRNSVYEYLKTHSINIDNPNHRNLLIRHIRQLYPDCSLDKVLVLISLALLGPRTSPLPKRIRNDFKNKLSNIPVDQDEADKYIREFAIAYGCGWGRTITKANEWDDIWPNCVMAVANLIITPIKEANEWFHRCVVGYPERKMNEIIDDSYLVAMNLIRPYYSPLQVNNEAQLKVVCGTNNTSINDGKKEFDLPPGAKVIYAIDGDDINLSRIRGGASISVCKGERIVILARDEETRITKHPRGGELRLDTDEIASSNASKSIIKELTCGCGMEKCHEKHCILYWNPKAIANGRSITLKDFLYSAVKGPNRSIATNTIIKGIYYPTLSREGII